MKIKHCGKLYESTEWFVDSAEYINEIFIDKFCKDYSINIYDFSNGLLTGAIQLNIDEFDFGE